MSTTRLSSLTGQPAPEYVWNAFQVDAGSGRPAKATKLGIALFEGYNSMSGDNGEEFQLTKPDARKQTELDLRAIERGAKSVDQRCACV